MKLHIVVIDGSREESIHELVPHELTSAVKYPYRRLLFHSKVPYSIYFVYVILADLVFDPYYAYICLCLGIA